MDRERRLRGQGTCQLVALRSWCWLQREFYGSEREGFLVPALVPAMGGLEGTELSSDSVTC